MTSRAPLRASRRRARCGALLLLAMLVACSAGAQQNPSPRAKAIGKNVMCMCGGCNDAAGLCVHSGGAFAGPCDVARSEMAEIDKRLSAGQSEDAILKSFVAQYGPTVLVDPPKQGFDWLAWIMPFALPLIAFIVVWLVIRHWRRASRVAPPASAGLSADLLARAHRESAGDHES
ncbi:MAG: cytochrome c-type biogenesis protein CcmH [Candidatus Acidiferrales bacterium]